MSKDYQYKRNNPFILPQKVYKATFKLIQNYNVIKSERVRMIISEALERIPEEYQKGVWEHVLYEKGYPLDAGEATYKRQQYKFIYFVAREFFII